MIVTEEREKQQVRGAASATALFGSFHPPSREKKKKHTHRYDSIFVFHLLFSLFFRFSSPQFLFSLFCTPFLLSTMSLEGRNIIIGGKYKLGRKIGAGSFGEIYLGKYHGLLLSFLSIFDQMKTNATLIRFLCLSDNGDNTRDIYYIRTQWAVCVCVHAFLLSFTIAIETCRLTHLCC